MSRITALMARSTLSRWRSPGIALVLGLLAVVIFTSPTTAAEVRSGDSPDVPAGTTVNTDLYIFGRDVNIDGNVTGDATVSAAQLTVRGTIGGDLQAATGTATVRGNVGHTIRVLSGSLTVYGTVGADIVTASGSVTVEPGATVKGDILAGGGDVTIRGHIGGEVRGNMGKLVIAGLVDGKVDVTVDQIRLDSGAQLAKSLSYRSRHQLEKAPAAAVTGAVSHSKPSRIAPTDNFTAWLGNAILRVLFGLVAGAIVILLVPRLSVSIADGVRHAPLMSLIVGLILLILLPVLIIILLVTVIGIPIALLALAFYVAALYLSQVFVGLAIGRFILPNSWGDEGRGYNLFGMVIGVVILGAIRLIPIPYISWIVAAITAVLGLGAIIVGIRRGHRSSVTFRPKIST